jgi:hypothetical protein
VSVTYSKMLSRRHGRACPGHPRGEAAAIPKEDTKNARLFLLQSGGSTAWMAGTSPAMTSHCFRTLVLTPNT